MGLRIAASLLACAAALCAAGPAVAGDPELPLDVPSRYQAFFVSPPARENSTTGSGRHSIDHETRLLSGGQVNYDTGAIGYSGPAGVSYFTPRLTGMGLGMGLSGNAAVSTDSSDLALGTAADGNSRNWRLGGSVGTSTLRVGAAFGDHPDPACREAGACKTNDFWDIGVAWHFGSGALSAGYTASQRWTLGVVDPETLGIFSLNAGYRIAPGLDVFGGVDWIELPATDGPQEQPRNTRFMLGTNLRF